MLESAYMFAPTCTHAFKIEPCACDYTYVCLPVRVYVSACVCTSACLCKAHVYVWIHMCACGHAYEICVHMSVHAHYFPVFPPLMTSLRHLPKLGRWPQATPPPLPHRSFLPPSADTTVTFEPKFGIRHHLHLKRTCHVSDTGSDKGQNDLSPTKTFDLRDSKTVIDCSLDVTKSVYTIFSIDFFFLDIHPHPLHPSPVPPFPWIGGH